MLLLSFLLFFLLVEIVEVKRVEGFGLVTLFLRPNDEVIHHIGQVEFGLDLRGIAQEIIKVEWLVLNWLRLFFERVKLEVIG